MRTTRALGLCLVLSLLLPIRAWSQRGGGGGGGGGGGENNAYLAIQDERTPQQRIKLIESFIDTYRNSAHRPELDLVLMNLYVGDRNWAMILKRAEDFRLEVPTADPKSRADYYTRAMLAATQVNNPQKTVEFGERILAADPNNLSALLTLSSTLMARLPQDAAGKDAAMNKALDYAKRVQSVPKPTGVTDEEFQRSQGRAHSMVGFIQLNKNQFDEAANEYAQALKMNPKDAEGHFRLGVAYYNQLASAIPTLQAAVKAVDDASAAKADQKKLEELVAKREEISKQLLDKRDLAIDSFARAVALGGDGARPQLETLYKNKANGTLDGLDQLISQKKAELGL
jgi:tetratricopeptide (TPR) repeat protein